MTSVFLTPLSPATFLRSMGARALCLSIAASPVRVGAQPSSPPTPAAAPPDAVQPTGTFPAASKAWVRAYLDIDTSAVGGSGPLVQRRIQERGDVVLRRAEVLPGATEDDARIRIVVREFDGADQGYAFETSVVYRGTAVEGSQQTIECKLCTEGELVDRVEDAIARLVPVAREVSQAPVPAPASSSPPSQSLGEPEVSAPPARLPPSRPPDRGPLPLKVYGRAGIGLMAAGLGVLVVGIGLTVNEPKDDPEDKTYDRTTEPPGIALLALGATSLAIGAVLLVYDRRQAKRERRLAWSPVIHGHFAGAMIGGRF